MERLTERPPRLDEMTLTYARLLPTFYFDRDRFLPAPFGDKLMKEALGFLPQASIVLALSTNCIWGLFRARAYAWIEWIFCNLLLRLNLLVLRFRPRDSLPFLSKKSITSFLSEFFSTLSFYEVLASLLIIRLSILLRLFITFSCIYVVLNSSITLLTCEFFLLRSCCYNA